MLNGIAPELWFSAATPIDESFRVRAADRRVYRFYDAQPPQSLARRAAAAALFSGLIDVRSVGRGLPAPSPVRRPVESVTETPLEGGSVIEVRAPSFVWGMVRKIVGAIREVDRNRLSLVRLRAALEGSARLSLPMAEPEPLVLWSVEFDVPWTFRWSGPNVHQARLREQQRAGWWARARVLDALANEEG